MTHIEKMRNFIKTCPFISEFSDGIMVNWNEQGTYGLMPMGQSTINRKEDILGNVILYKQYNFALYATEYTVDDLIRIESIGFLDRFTEWLENESIQGRAPTFGDNPEEEEMSAQNGMLYQLYDDGKTGRYQLQISVKFEKHIKEE